MRLGRQPGFHRLSAVGESWPSGLAVAPKVASAPRGPGSATLAGNRVQSLPRANRGYESGDFYRNVPRGKQEHQQGQH